MKKICFFIFSMVFLLLSEVSAQGDKQAEAVVDKLLQLMKIDAVSADFVLTINDKSLPQPQVLKGDFTLKGNKLRMETEEIAVFFDGKTQWLYMAQNEEVSITEPDEQEITDINPMAILHNFRAKSSVRFAEKAPSDANYYIDITPKNTKEDIEKIELALNKNNNSVVYIKQKNKNGGTMSLQLKNFKSGVKVPDNVFVFDKSKYPNAEINDLR